VNPSVTTGCWGEDSNQHWNRRGASKADAPVSLFSTTLSKHARIVNVSSESGSLTVMGGGTPAYSVSKAALNALTRMLADELRASRILVNSVCPGWVDTDMGGPNAPRSVEEGAASVMWAAMLPDDGPLGGFFRDGEPLAW
jgi:NAD(P)-dependent dehydrogenase (short-subunit alcohol dehydrogenase family)